MTAKRPVRIFDTTLRDGEQAPGNSMTAPQKVEIALLLDALGVDVIEAGFPASSAVDRTAAREIARRVERAAVCCFARCDRADIDIALDALAPARRPQLELATIGSDVQLAAKRGMTRQEAVRELTRSVRYARDRGVPEILIGIEDASRADPHHLRALVERGLEAGGTALVFADTVGRCLPAETQDYVGRLKDWGAGAPVAVHCHNDLGLATANTLAAAAAGADEIQVTLCGIGERAGNAALEEVVAGLDTRADALGRAAAVRPDLLHAACARLLEVVGERMPRAKAVIGANAFATEAGMHQQAIIRDPGSYELLAPERYGRRRRLVLGRHSGRAAVRRHLVEQGIDPDPAVVDRVYAELTG